MLWFDVCSCAVLCCVVLCSKWQSCSWLAIGDTKPLRLPAAECTNNLPILPYNCHPAGETLPDDGMVWKHPNLRLAYVAQHAFHHVEQHLDQTPAQYIWWR